uniref:Helicase-associated domain-containing protein n=1 Tax=Leptocylindrus danicus TaxID=163516 RepID=A0A7S2L897_9STRA
MPAHINTSSTHDHHITLIDETITAAAAAGREEQPYVEVHEHHTEAAAEAAEAADGSSDDIQNIEVAVLTALGRRHNNDTHTQHIQNQTQNQNQTQTQTTQHDDHHHIIGTTENNHHYHDERANLMTAAAQGGGHDEDGDATCNNACESTNDGADGNTFACNMNNKRERDVNLDVNLNVHAVKRSRNGNGNANTNTCDENANNSESNKAVIDAAARDRWLIKFGELRHFRATNGHCNVPRNCKESLQLGKWVNNQRFEYKKYIQRKTSKMSEERIKLLEGEGFQWSMVEHVPWEQRFNEVVAYKAIHGNCRVPKRYPTNQPLANWVDKQRKEFKLLQNGKKSSMTSNRIELLNGVGFAWVAISEVSWEERLQELIAYKTLHGNCLVPNKYQDNHALGRWVDKQRQDYRKYKEGKRSVMTEERIKILESHGFCWSVDDYAWEQRLAELVDYKLVHGNCLVPHNYSANPQLANWVIQQRQDYKKLCQGRKSAMKQHRFAKLNAAGFEWNAGRAHAAQHALGPRPVYPPVTYPGVVAYQPQPQPQSQSQPIISQQVMMNNDVANPVGNATDHQQQEQQQQQKESVVVDESIIDTCIVNHQHDDDVLDPVPASHGHDPGNIANV